jgi:CRISPR-associated protein Cas1
MRGRVLKIEMKDYGNYLGRGSGCFYVSDRNRKKTEYRHFAQEIGECVLKDGNSVSVDALRDLALFNIDTYIMTRYDRIVGFLVNPEDNSHVKTRLCQYQAYLDKDKSIKIIKTILKAKINGQNKVLEKYDLNPLDYSIIERQMDGVHAENLETARRKLMQIESKFSRYYFSKIFSSFPEKIRPERRMTHMAYDGLNNVFNFAYHILKMRVHKALLKAKLEPYLGFLHSMKFGNASLVFDMMELYRYLIDDFLLERRMKFHKKDFVLRTDTAIKLKHYDKRIVLHDYKTNGLTEDLFLFFERMVDVPRICHGNRQSIGTLISEEALLLAKYLRNEMPEWKPRTVDLNSH